MPEKNVREMTARERRHYSIAARSFRGVMALAFILGAVAILIDVTMYSRAVAQQYISDAYNLSAGAAAIISASADPADCVEKVMSEFRSMSEEELEAQRTMAYQDRFRFLRFDENYRQVLAILKFLKENNDVFDLYLSVYDEQSMKMIYIADPEERSDLRCPPGTWEPVDQKELDIFLHPGGEDVPYVFTNDEYGWLCTSGVPVTDRDGTIVGYIQADISVVDVGGRILQYLIQFALVLLLLTLVLAILFVRYFKKTLVRPINLITGAAEQYVKDRRAGLEITDHFSRKALNIRTGDEVENLSLVMADMERDLAEYEENLAKITAEKERIGMELALATRIQADMLPNIFPAFPGRKEFDIFASMEPAKEVGGDFYDFFLVDQDHLCMIMADVSGKGVPAALFMMASKIILASCAMLGQGAAEILTKTNEAICSNNREEMFVTVWVGILDLTTGKLTAANAGHEYPVLKKPEGGFELLKDRHGFVLGGMEGVRYKEYELRLEPGAKLFLYTDGVPEATDGQNEMFGTERMLEALNREPDAPPEIILKNVRTAVTGFVGEAEQFDDLTMLCMEYRGQPDPQGAL